LYKKDRKEDKVCRKELGSLFINGRRIRDGTKMYNEMFFWYVCRPNDLLGKGKRHVSVRRTLGEFL